MSLGDNIIQGSLYDTNPNFTHNIQGKSFKSTIDLICKFDPPLKKNRVPFDDASFVGKK